jgi:ectoine hydroxylase-related dioxygenase (phytanoyl-CoA dioxygenase family)
VDPPDAVPLELRAGSIAVFSSLTPHRTGPNGTTGVRKAYILQYAPDGATMYPAQGDAVACDAPERQYPILVRGVPV